jgi:hypothetical protein
LPLLASSIPGGILQITTTNIVGGVAIPVVNFVPVSIISTTNFPGAQSVDTGEHPGYRVTLGAWLDAEQRWGLEGGYYDLERRTSSFNVNNSNQLSQINIDTGLSSTILIAAPGGGAVQIAQPVFFPRQALAQTRGSFATELWGAEVNALYKSCYFGPTLFTTLAGFRYNEFEEQVALGNNVTLFRPANIPADLPGTNFPASISFSTLDLIRTHNQFFGAQVGLEMDTQCAGFFFNGRIKCAFGGVRQEANVLGATVVTGTALPINSSGGLLSGPGDPRQVSRTRFATLPELNLKVGYQFGPYVRCFLGYDALYMQHVARPGGQTDFAQLNTQINVAATTAQVNVFQPVIRLRDQDVWIQGFNAGVEFRY